MIRLVVPGKPVTQNDVRRAGHWATVRAAKRRVAADATYAALSTWGLRPPRLTFPVEVTVEDCCRTANLRDVEACAPSVKAILDALTDYGLWPDDSPAYVASVTYRAPVKTGTDALILTITAAGIHGECPVSPLAASGAEKGTTTAHPTPKEAK